MQRSRWTGPRSTVPLGLLAAVLLVAANLRPAFTSLGPVLPDIRDDLGLSGAAASLLTALPILCLGALAPLALPLSRRFGVERALAIALVALGAGLLLRVLGGWEALVLGTVAVGGAIAVGNVLLPVIVKRDFVGSSGRVTGLYTATMSVTAALAAAATVPIGDALGTGWRGGLAAWALLVVVALAAFLPRIAAQERPALIASAGPARTMLRDRLAWQVTFFLGLQSLGFYALVAWLPSIYRDLGVPPGEAGLLAAAVPLAAAVGGLVVPARAARAPDQRAAALLVSIGTAAGLVGLMVAPLAAPLLWVLVAGFSQGGGFPLALTLVVLRTRTPAQTRQLSAMAHTVGYLVAATGPLAVGAIHDVAGGWAAPIGLVVGLTVLQGIVGLFAGRAGHVGEGLG